MTRHRTADTSILLLGSNPVYTLIPALMLGTDVRRQTYEDLIAGRRFSFRSRVLHVMFFFPYHFWNTRCEDPEEDRLYGVDPEMYARFRRYWKRVEKAVRRNYPDKIIRFVMDPETVHVDRDKVLTRDLLADAGLRVTKSFETRDIDALLSEVRRGRGLFIKSRYGSEGKGITRIGKERWMTNYRLKGRSGIANHGIMGKWPFADVTGNRAFLKNLLSRDVIVEREIVSSAAQRGRKADVRLYVVGGRVVHLFLRHSPKRNIITNWSQGGEVEDHVEAHLTREQILSAKRQAVLAADALNSDFIGIDCMFDRDDPDKAVVVEAQCMCSFPKPEVCNLGEELVRMIISKDRSIKAAHAAEKEKTAV